MRRTVFLLALPVLLEQFLSFCVGAFDTWLSGRLRSPSATAAVGLAAYVGWLGSLIFSFVGTGTTAVVARCWGAGDFATANRAASRSITLAVFVGLIACGSMWMVAPKFPELIGVGGETAAVMVRYLRIDAFGYLFYGVALIGAAALRGAGHMRPTMLILGFVSVCNVVASPLLVFGTGPIPALGVDGIVGGTVIARVGGGLLMLFALSRGIGGLRLRVTELAPWGEVVWRVLRVGIPAALDGLLMWGGHFVFLMIIGRLAVGELQEAMLAAHMIGIQVEAIVYLPAVAWGHAAATLIGQALGAGQRERARRVGHEAVLQCSLLVGVIAVAFFAGARGIYEVMTNYEEPGRSELVRSVGVPAFRFLAFFEVPLVIGIIYVFALRGAGDTRFPMLFTLFGVYGIRIPVAWLCGIELGWGLLGAWVGMCADVTVRAMLAGARFVRGKWVETVV